MLNEPRNRRVEVSFLHTPPAAQITRATGVSDVELDGHTVRCFVWGSFQPFLESLRGHEVICLSSSVVQDSAQLKEGCP
jgi:hypothetical protein